MIPTLLRAAEHRALAGITLSGRVLDLGGDARGAYRALVKGEFSLTTVNLDDKAKPEIFHDLEKPLPVADGAFDHALLINVLEHIFDYRQLLREAVRAVAPGGSIIIIVPFLFPLHPSPRDYWRFSADALKKECALAGLSVASCVPLGSGVFAARMLMLDRLMPLPFRALTYLLRPLVYALDAAFAGLARMTRRKYDPADYALGYCVQALKP